MKFAREYYSKSGVSDVRTNTLEVPQPPATITADDILPELSVVPSASPRTRVLDVEELQRRLEKLQEGTPIMNVSKLRGEVERLEPSQSVAFSEGAGAPAVPQESPRVASPRRRQMAMRFEAQPMPQAPKPPPILLPPGKSSEEIPQIKTSDILPQAPTPSVPPPLPKSPFIFSSQLQPKQFQSLTLPKSPFSSSFTSLPPQSNIKLPKPTEPYLPIPQSFTLPPADQSEIEKLLYGKPQEPSGPSGPRQTNYRQILEDRRARIISDMGYPPIDEIEDIMQIGQVYNMKDELKNDIRIQTGKLVGLQNKKNKTTEDENNIAMQKELTDTMVKYRNKLLDHLKFLERTQLEGDDEDEIFGEGRAQRGQGIKYFNSPAQLFDRLELLAGSISAGNNGVANEFTEIIHVLRNMGILSQTVLNKLLRKFVPGNIIK